MVIRPIILTPTNVTVNHQQGQVWEVMSSSNMIEFVVDVTNVNLKLETCNIWGDMLQSAHEGVCYSCNICDPKSETVNNLEQHVEWKHIRIAYMYTLVTSVNTNQPQKLLTSGTWRRSITKFSCDQYKQEHSVFKRCPKVIRRFKMSSSISLRSCPSLSWSCPVLSYHQVTRSPGHLLLMPSQF